VLSDCNGCCFGLIKVTWVDNGHSRKHLHQSNILKDLVRSTILSKGKTGMGSTYFYIFIRICDRLSDLIVNPSSGKVGKSTCKWNFTSNGKSSSDPHHVRLSDTDLEKPLWILFNKICYL